MGLFAGSGVGKSVLLGHDGPLHQRAEVIVVGLIGERGREVKEFVERILGPKDSPARWSSPRRRIIRRSCGCTARGSPPPSPNISAIRASNVLLLMDSLTRFAQAQREIALAIGEAPATKGYPPSVFARLPQLVERAGNGATRLRLHHRLLHRSHRGRRPERSDRRCRARDSRRPHRASRRIAESGHYPAIDVEASISRAMHEIAAAPHIAAARQFRQALSTYQQHRDLIAIGAYQRGSDPRVDQALALWPRMQRFLQQDMRERVDLAASLAALTETLSEPSTK